MTTGATKSEATIEGICNNLITLLGAEGAWEQVMKAYFGVRARTPHDRHGEHQRHLWRAA